jgi:hypothetical protein
MLDDPWPFLVTGYLFTTLIELPILLFGLSRPHPWRHRLEAGLLLTAVTYPMVVLALPRMIDPTYSRVLYLLAAEAFAIGYECWAFARVYHRITKLDRFQKERDFAAIVLANLASFSAGELYYRFFWGA